MMTATIFVLAALIASVNGLEAEILKCNTPCTQDQCKKQKCDLSVPFACVSGAASGGCSSVPSHFDNTTQCTACCNIASCAITCSPCTASQCVGNPCGATAPYLCTAGLDKAGCATKNNTWSNNPGCSACCDASTCAPPTVAPAPPTPAPKAANCAKSCGDFCTNAARCPTSTPYMCIAGNSTDGCAVKESSWNGPDCTSCCDVRMCPTAPCGDCSSTMCSTTQCSLTNPYICTGGLLNGGCSPVANYWPTSPDCTSCCNYNNCPQ